MKFLVLLMVIPVLFQVRTLTLTVVAKHIRVGKGRVVVAIWDDEKNFFKKPFAAKMAEADRDSLVFFFELKEGIYAISVYQDMNGNGKLDLGFFHQPVEPVGFGNNFKPKFSTPGYSDCAISLTRSHTEEIALK